jgi:hypothetical protein
VSPEKKFPVCRYCGKTIYATVSAEGHPPVAFCGCKKSMDAAIAKLKAEKARGSLSGGTGA